MSPLTFLFVPFDATGDINCCIGLGQELLKKGHKVAIAISNSWKGKLTPLGFVEKFYQDETQEAASVDRYGEIVRNITPALKLPPLEKMEQFNVHMYVEAIKNTNDSDPKLRQIVAEVKPDLILVGIIHAPALCDIGIPWITMQPCSPLGISVEDVPPPFCGFPVMSGDKTLWVSYRERERKAYTSLFEDFRNWVLEKGGPELHFDGRSVWTKSSPYGNVYIYPKELDYTINRPNPQNWFHFDTFVRTESEPFQVPAQLEPLPGKLIYFSMGTIGCCELELMRKLIGICGKSPNRFIVSKGPLGDELELPKNMFGGKSLPQTNVLPLVDLVITHGGNNTITESFYFGKRVLVLPLFMDQLDNGTRVEETGLGLQFDPYKVNETELLDGIERLLGDSLLEKRMKTISLRMKGSNSQLRAAEFFEEIAQNNLT